MKDILVIGSGIVGICTGIELIERGHSVTLIDPNDPGSQTSYGNAGVITDSSLIIINNPQLLKSLFSLIFKKKLHLDIQNYLLFHDFFGSFDFYYSVIKNIWKKLQKLIKIYKLYH